MVEYGLAVLVAEDHLRGAGAGRCLGLARAGFLRALCLLARLGTRGCSTLAALAAASALASLRGWLCAAGFLGLRGCDALGGSFLLGGLSYGLEGLIALLLGTCSELGLGGASALALLGCALFFGGLSFSSRGYGCALGLFFGHWILRFGSALGALGAALDRLGLRDGGSLLVEDAVDERLLIGVVPELHAQLFGDAIELLLAFGEQLSDVVSLHICEYNVCA